MATLGRDDRRVASCLTCIAVPHHLRLTSAGLLSLAAWQRGARVIGQSGLTLEGIRLAGRGHVDKWQPWLAHGNVDQRVDILHKQLDILVERINEVRRQVDRASDDLEKKIKEAETRVTKQVKELASDVSGERSQASRVDARGLGPIALGIVLTGLPDELATFAWVGTRSSLVLSFGSLPQLQAGCGTTNAR